MSSTLNIETGDNLLVSTDSWLGRTIQKFEKNSYNHAGKLFWINNVLYVSEADKYGISLTKLTHYTNNPSKYKLLVQKPVVPFTEEEVGKMYNFAIPKSGHIKYDYINLLVYQPIKFLTFGKIWLGSKDSDKQNRRYICGEWVARIDNEIRGWFSNWSKVAPVDLYNSDKYNNFYLNI